MTETAKQDKPTTAIHPRVFVSYCWTSQSHQAWVLKLCTELRHEGADIILDKWELKEGHDTYAYMERMVTDPSVKKVLVVSDRKYAEKADRREGGVGTETQIISAEVYNKVDQDKFIPIVAEFIGNEACLPTFMKGRFYIDLSSQAKYNENYDQVLRAIHNRPIHQKPELGSIPKRIFEDAKIQTTTQPKFRACVEAIKQGKTNVPGLLREYFDEMINVWKGFSICPPDPAVPLDEVVLESIKDALTVRDEIVELLHILFMYRDESDDFDLIRTFFEQIAGFRKTPHGVNRWNDSWADNYVFINYELFLHTVALLLKHEKFRQLGSFIEEPYFVRDEGRMNGRYDDVRVFLGNASSIDEERKVRLKSNRISLVADLIKERATNPHISFEQILLADLVILLRCLLDPRQRSRWYPKTLIYAANHNAFEIFARGESPRGFEKVKVLLGVKDKPDLVQRLKDGMKNAGVAGWTASFWCPEDAITETIGLQRLNTLQ